MALVQSLRWCNRLTIREQTIHLAADTIRFIIFQCRPRHQSIFV